MKRYAITEKAGRFVAGRTNTGLGTILTLTLKQAEHELRLGTLRALDEVELAADDDEEEEEEDEPAALVFADMTVRELTEFAAARDIPLAAGLRKAEIITAIEAALSAE